MDATKSCGREGPLQIFHAVSKKHGPLHTTIINVRQDSFASLNKLYARIEKKKRTGMYLITKGCTSRSVVIDLATIKIAVSIEQLEPDGEHRAKESNRHKKYFGVGVHRRVDCHQFRDHHGQNDEREVVRRC